MIKKILKIFILILAFLIPIASKAQFGPYIVPQGGTGASTFSQGIIYSEGGTNALVGTSTPTVTAINTSSSTATSSIAGNLTVGGNLRVTGSSLFTLVTSGALTMTGNIALNGNWLSGDGDNEGVYVSSTGNVGIGTSSPDSKLRIVGTSRWDDSTVTALKLSSGVTGEENKHLRMGYDSVGSNDFAYLQSAETASGVKNLVLQGQGGNVGVGVTNPTSLVHVDGSTNLANFGGLTITEPFNNDFRISLSLTDGNRLRLTNTLGQLNKGNSRVTVSDSGVELQASGNTDITLTTAGNVGIGTTTPGAKVTVQDGDVYVSSSTRGIILTRPDGTCARGTLSDLDVLSFTSVTCP